MHWFRNTTISRKLVVVMMLTSCVALLLAATGFTAHQVLSFRRSMTERLSSLADVIGANSAGALAFEDRAAAERIVASVEGQSYIVAACLYYPGRTASGRVSARQRRCVPGRRRDLCQGRGRLSGPLAPGDVRGRAGWVHRTDGQPAGAVGEPPTGGTYHLRSADLRPWCGVGAGFVSTAPDLPTPYSTWSGSRRQ